MAAHRLRTTIVLSSVLALGACATSSPDRAERAGSPESVPARSAAGAPSRPSAIRFDVESALPVFTEMRNDEALLASRLSASVDEDLLNYRADWSVRPGDVLAPGRGEAAKSTPATRLGIQQLGQNVSLRLPELAGSPVSLGLSTEFRNELLVSGYRQSQHEQATLKWSPGPATMAVQWAGTATPFGAGTALACDLRSSVRLPTHRAPDHSEGLSISGGICSVTADGTAYAGLETRTLGLGYAWDRSDRKTEAVMSMVELAEAPAAWRNLSPGYELALSHRRDFGPLSAETRVSLREAPKWEYALLLDSPLPDIDTSLNTHTALTWSLSHASLSANWVNGVDRLWFTPESGTQSDRFGLALNLSRWLRVFVPDASPELAMNWNWSQLRTASDEITGENALSLDVALHF